MVQKVLTGLITLAAASVLLSDRGQATEAAAGRYIPGMYAAPGAGIVPPVPGTYWEVANVFYSGKAGGQIPFGGDNIAFGFNADIWGTALAGLYVPKLDLPGNWTYAVAATIPVGWMGSSGTIANIRREKDVGGLGDIAITPILLGWHNDAMNTFLSASFTVTAPTGEWERAIAFVGLNYWSFQPALGFTHLIPDHGIDVSAKLGVDINTRNDAANYYSGAMGHLDLAVTKTFANHLSIGALAGFLYQFEDDDSRFANTRSDGFKGRSIAVGALMKYEAHFSEKAIVEFALRWAHELEVKNRMKGNALFFEISGKF